MKVEAWQQFVDEDVAKKSQEALFALEAYFQTEKETLVQDFVDAIRRICLNIKDMQAKGTKGKIGYITFSMLRTELLEGKNLYLIEASDSNWFFDRKECVAVYDATWAFQFLRKLEGELEQERLRYMNAIPIPYIGKIKLQEAVKFHKYVVSLARYAMPFAVTTSEFQDIEIEEELEIRVGEYMDASEVVYKKDARVKNSASIKAWLEETAKDEYAYEVFANLDLSCGKYKGIDLRFADMRQCNLQESNLSNSLLVGVKFAGSDLVKCNFSYSLIQEADFRWCNLQGARFQGAEGYRGLWNRSAWEMPGFLEVNFTGANLQGADFTDANLKGAIFVGANLENATFTGANLDQAVFSIEDADHIRLDDTQRKNVIWKGTS